MPLRSTIFAFVGTFLSGSLAAAAQVPSGTELSVRLTVPVSSNQPSGTAVGAVLTVPVFINGAPAISAGAILAGKTADVSTFKAASGDTSEKPATVRMEFGKISPPGQTAKSISSTLLEVDNARETVDESGLVVGIRASDTFGAQLDRGVKKLESKYEALGGLIAAVKDQMVKPVDPSIDFPAGVDLKIKLTKALDWSEPAAPQTAGPITPADQLATLVNAQPFRTVAMNPPDPSDLTNLMFIGTEDQVKEAFTKAGWFAADALSQTSKMETARAIIENRGYKEAPMSILTLDKRPPDLAMQKQTDTFSKRHHIRIWKRPDQFDGKPIWIAAATHDISITFSQVSKSFTHGIDPNIDAERSKVTNDLLFTKMVKNVALVDRPDIPHDASNATGDKLVTDGKMAVLEF